MQALVRGFISEQENGTRAVLEVCQAEANLAALEKLVAQTSDKFQKVLRDVKDGASGLGRRLCVLTTVRSEREVQVAPGQEDARGHQGERGLCRGDAAGREGIPRDGGAGRESSLSP